MPYIDNLNNLIEGTEFADLPLEDVIRDAKGALFNNASQAWNHIFYFFSFSPDGGGEPDGELRKAIDRDFGSFENFKKEFVDAGVMFLVAGWFWVSRENNGKLFPPQQSSVEPPLTNVLPPILSSEVWEITYFLYYENRRKDALEKLWDIIDWPIVEGRY